MDARVAGRDTPGSTPSSTQHTHDSGDAPPAATTRARGGSRPRARRADLDEQEAQRRKRVRRPRRRPDLSRRQVFSHAQCRRRPGPRHPQVRECSRRARIRRRQRLQTLLETQASQENRIQRLVALCNYGVAVLKASCPEAAARLAAAVQAELRDRLREQEAAASRGAKSADEADDDAEDDDGTHDEAVSTSDVSRWAREGAASMDAAAAIRATHVPIGSQARAGGHGALDVAAAAAAVMAAATATANTSGRDYLSSGPRLLSPALAPLCFGDLGAGALAAGASPLQRPTAAGSAAAPAGMASVASDSWTAQARLQSSFGSPMLAIPQQQGRAGGPPSAGEWAPAGHHAYAGSFGATHDTPISSTPQAYPEGMWRVLHLKRRRATCTGDRDEAQRVAPGPHLPTDARLPALAQAMAWHQAQEQAQAQAQARAPCGPIANL